MKKSKNELMRFLLTKRPMPIGFSRMPIGFRKEIVELALADITNLFIEKMQVKYSWFAICTVAVQAGCWKGNRIIERRKNLFRVMNVLRKELGMDVIGEPDFKFGLRFGYGACRTQAEVNVALLMPLFKALVKN